MPGHQRVNLFALPDGLVIMFRHNLLTPTSRHLVSETEGILPTVPREEAAATSTAELWGVSPQFHSCALT